MAEVNPEQDPRPAPSELSESTHITPRLETNAIGLFSYHENAEDADWTIERISEAVARNPGRQIRVMLECAIPVQMPADFQELSRALDRGWLGVRVHPLDPFMGKMPPVADLALRSRIASSHRVMKSLDRTYLDNPPSDRQSIGGLNDYPDYDRRVHQGLYDLKQRGVSIHIHSEKPSMERYLGFLQIEAQHFQTSIMILNGHPKEALQSMKDAVGTEFGEIIRRDKEYEEQLAEIHRSYPEDLLIIPRGIYHRDSMAYVLDGSDLRFELDYFHDLAREDPYTRMVTVEFEYKSEDGMGEAEYERALIEGMFYVTMVSSLVVEFGMEREQAEKVIGDAVSFLQTGHSRDWLMEVCSEPRDSRAELARDTAEWMSGLGFTELAQRISS